MATCSHLDQVKAVTPKSAGCAECLLKGESWVHLRMCMSCGHVGCCDDSKNKHATQHFHETDHAIVKSLEPGEDWKWCYADEMYVELTSEPAALLPMARSQRVLSAVILSLRGCIRFQPR